VIKEVLEWVERERAARIARERALVLAEKKPKCEEVNIPEPKEASPPSEIQGGGDRLGSDPG